MKDHDIRKDFERACEHFARMDVDVPAALRRLKAIEMSLPCWQGDDVRGFEQSSSSLDGSGLQVTGGHPGRARNIRELQDDMALAFRLLPGRHRANIHAIYGDFDGKIVDRDEITPEHFHKWSGWAASHKVKLDFNATCFAHPLASSGYTLSNSDPKIRKFWIRHVVQARRITAWLAAQQKTQAVHNLWIPDGAKESPADRVERRSLLRDSLDEIFDVKLSSRNLLDAVESKVFGIGSESFVVGSHEFYLGYALRRGLMVCLDMGHFHPTESVADKISSILLFSPGILLHMSRGVRWDSDHVVLLNDELMALCREAVRSGRINDIHFALDFFDATQNRVGAWVLGGRSLLKGLLLAFLEPTNILKKLEHAGDKFGALWMAEQLKTMPISGVWDYYCRQADTALDSEVHEQILKHEKSVLADRE